MSTPKKSTGPNALQTGIHSAAEVLPSEDPAVLDALVAEYYASFQPNGPAERSFLDDLIRAEWTLRRLRRTEAQLNSFAHQNFSRADPDLPLGQAAVLNPKAFSALQWRINATRKARKDAVAVLRQLRENPVPHAA
jgi:hypothetical protein